MALACALALGAVDRETIRSYDALIGVLWAVGMAVGVVFVYKTPGYAPNLMTYLFGNILLVTRHDLWLILVLAVSVLFLLVLFFKGIVAVAFDEVFARVRGVPVRLLMCAAARHDRPLGGDPDPGRGDHPGGGAADHPLGDQPDALEGPAERARSARSLIGVGITLGGLLLSFQYDLPSGPAIILLGAVLLSVVYGVRRCPAPGGLARRDFFPHRACPGADASPGGASLPWGVPSFSRRMRTFATEVRISLALDERLSPPGADCRHRSGGRSPAVPDHRHPGEGGRDLA